MNQVKLNEYVKERKIVIPLYFLKMYKEFNLNIDELVLLFYLYDKDKIVFDPTIISKDLEEDTLFVMQNISTLTDKGLINVSALKDGKGLMEEVIDLSPLYNILSLKIMEQLNTNSIDEENIHHLIEQEFGRRLTPLEHEMIDDWEKNNYNKKLIKEAVKEASINGVSNLRYIDKILFDWNKQGIKVPADIKKNEKKESVTEIYECDWLNDDDEEI